MCQARTHLRIRPCRPAGRGASTIPQTKRTRDHSKRGIIGRAATEPAPESTRKNGEDFSVGLRRIRQSTDQLDDIIDRFRPFKPRPANDHCLLRPATESNVAPTASSVSCTRARPCALPQRREPLQSTDEAVGATTHFVPRRGNLRSRTLGRLTLSLAFAFSLASCFWKSNRVTEAPPVFPAVPAAQVQIVNRLPPGRFESLGFLTVQQDRRKPPSSALSIIRELAAAKGATAAVFISSGWRSFRNGSNQRIQDQIFTYLAIHEY